MGLKILMLSWEYPPDHVGGLGRHVASLSKALAQKGAEVTVLTRRSPGRPEIRYDEGVRVLSAGVYGLHPPDFVTWAAQFNVSLMEEAMRMLPDERFDIIHAHDWIVAYAARALKHGWNIPLVATIHATECGRQKGLHNPAQAHISETEWWLCYEAWRVIACSDYMKKEIHRTFGVPFDKIRTIPNGISDEWFQVPREPQKNPLVIYVGRLVPEKGPQVLVDAMSEIVMSFPNAKLILAGGGPMEGELRKNVWESGLRNIVQLVGHQGDKELKRLYSEAWVACFPSSYEPFGIVALEAMATGVSLVVGDAGGLSEVVENMITGIKVRPDDPWALASAIKSLIGDSLLREKLARRAKARAKDKFSWDDIAASTIDVYTEVKNRASKRVLHTV